MPTPPTMPTAKAGTTSVTLNTGTKTLSPGAYGTVLVNAGATLTLSGGTYVFASLPRSTPTRHSLSRRRRSCR